MKLTIALHSIGISIVLAVSAHAQQPVPSAGWQATDSAAFFPQLNDSGTQLLYGTTDGAQLFLKDLTTGGTHCIDSTGHAGFNAVWGADGKVYYVTQEQRKQRLIYRTGHIYDPSTGRHRIVLKAQHGAVHAVRGTHGVAIVGERKSWNLKKAGTVAWTLGDRLYVAQKGKTRCVRPVQGTVGLLWAKVSPDGQKVAFVAAGQGLVACDLGGHELRRYGLFLMPNWLSDSQLVVMSNGGNIRYSGSCLWLVAADGGSVTKLTPDSLQCIQPMTAQGRVAYTTPAGKAHVFTPDLTQLPASQPLQSMGGTIAEVTLPLFDRQEAPRVFVNPGHGGHDSDDRFEPFYNQAAADTVPYYESDSNLGTGSALVRYLTDKGYQVFTSRTGNATEDDLNLFEIRSLAENSGADLFFAIHSNDTGLPVKRINFPLAIYRGYTGQPCAEGSDSLAACVMRRLYANEATAFSGKPQISGDWTFYARMWGPRVGLGVLRYNTLPGLLSEGAFHDYLPERERLLNLDYCGLEGWNHSLAIDEYFGRSDSYNFGKLSGLVRSDALRPDTATVVFGDDCYAPMSGVTVTLKDSEGKIVATYTTDFLNNGFYTFDRLKPGTYTVTAGTETKSAIVLKNQAAYCNFLIHIQQNNPQIP